jgi:cobalt-zinc-cadmium efflux system outer membrane protein
LPRFLVDPATVPIPEVVEPPAVPVADRPAVTLADAVSECVLNNLRLTVGAERIRAAQADYVSESVIPNCQLAADAQMLPLTPLNPANQAGPPQYDGYLTAPVDWFLFGKRVAARAAARAGVDVAQAEFADLLRKEIAQTVDAFYEALEADAAIELGERRVRALEELEKLARGKAKGDGSADADAKRIHLSLLDAQRELRKGQATAATMMAKLKARLGRPPDSPDFVVRGALMVRAVAPPMSVAQAWAIAEQNRPDLVAARRAVAAADAAVVRERRRAFPQVALTAGIDYQDQVRITGFRNATLWTVSASTTLPFTDRNQGKLLAAESAARSARAALGVATTDARAEVEQAVAEYIAAVNGVTGEDLTSLRSAREVRDEAREAYRKGDKSLLDVLDAEQAYRDRFRHGLDNLTDYWQALNHLNAAVGQWVVGAFDGAGDWRQDLGRDPAGSGP